MNARLRGITVATVLALVTACAPQAQKTPPTQVQVNFNLPMPGQAGEPRRIERGAVSGTPQHVGFFYSVNPDCSSGGLVQTQLKTQPAHGAVAFVQTEEYTGFPPNSPSYSCNKQKSPGIAVMYTSDRDFVGTDRFTVQGIGPKGVYMETEYTVRVLPSTKAN